MTRLVRLLLLLVVACHDSGPRSLWSVPFDHRWQEAVCAPGTASDPQYSDEGAQQSVGLTKSFRCRLELIDSRRSDYVRVHVRGDRDPSSMWCAMHIGPGVIDGPVSPDSAIAIVEDPLLAARLRTAFIGVDPRREYDLETTREGVHLSAHQHRSGAGVTLELGVDACQPSSEPETRRVGGVVFANTTEPPRDR
ncbi:MAG TPA: hypothetical protein VGL61_13610 [Kofleriaceae bacterium]